MTKHSWQNSDSCDGAEQSDNENNLIFPEGRVYSPVPYPEDDALEVNERPHVEADVSQSLHDDLAKKDTVLRKHTVLCIEPQDKESRIRQYLYSEDSPWNQEWVVYVARTPLPGESSFSVETLEPAIASPRRAYSSRRRAEVAYTRSNGGACGNCRRNKQACLHRLRELEQPSYDGSTTAVETVSERLLYDYAGRTPSYQFGLDRRGSHEDRATASSLSASGTTLGSSTAATQRVTAQHESFQSQRGNGRDTSSDVSDIRAPYSSGSYIDQSSGSFGILLGISGGTSPSNVRSTEPSILCEFPAPTRPAFQAQSDRRSFTEADSNNLATEARRPGTPPGATDHSLPELDTVENLHGFRRQAGLLHNERYPLFVSGYSPLRTVQESALPTDGIEANMLDNTLSSEHDNVRGFDINEFISWPREEHSEGQVPPSMTSSLLSDAALQHDSDISFMDSEGLRGISGFTAT